ncbi:MAG: SufE family protein [Planctomycetes bacterium]|nr:SufE family protein [Planctomycetota bacterium]
MDSSPTITLEELIEEFEALGDWEAQCEFLIDLGFELPKLPPELKTEETRVRGCQSNVWMVIELKEGSPRTVEIRAESDAMLVNGLIAVLLSIYSGKTPREILAVDVQDIFHRLGLDRHLSTARRNGLHSMVQRIREFAEQAARKESHAES